MGSLGKSNRTRYYKDKENKKTVEDDWNVIAKYIKEQVKSNMFFQIAFTYIYAMI